MLNAAGLVALAVVGVALLNAAAAILRWPAPILLFAGGVAASFLPGLPDGRTLDPLILIGLILPPLLYASSVEVSVHLLRFQWLRGLVLGLVLHAAIVGVIAGAAKLVFPFLPWPGAILLGIVLATGDEALAKDTGLANKAPRPVLDAMRGHGVVAPLLLLTLFVTFADHAGREAPGLGDLAWAYAKDWIGGGLIGLALGAGVVALRRRLTAASVEIAVSLATPFAASALSQLAKVSVAAIIVPAAVMVARAAIDRRTGDTLSSPETRLIGRHFWRETKLVLTGMLYLLVGFALPDALAGARDWNLASAALLAVLALVLASLVQYAVGWLSFVLQPSRETSPVEAGRAGLLMSALPGRAALGLLIALAVPVTGASGEAVPERNLILVVMTIAVALSTCLQLTLLPRIGERLGPDDPGRAEETELVAQTIVGVVPRRAPPGAGPPADDAPGDADAARRARLDLLALRARDAIGDDGLLHGAEAVDLAVRAVEARTEAPKGE